MVVMADGGFGHTITGPDSVRRVFKGRKCIFLTISEFNRHNQQVAAIWPDITHIFLPISLGITFGNQSFPFPKFYSALLRQWARGKLVKYILVLARSKVVALDLMKDVYTSTPEDFLSTSKNTLRESQLWAMYYYKLIQDISVIPAELPKRWKTSISRKLDRAINDSEPKEKSLRCTLYIRRKGAGGNATDESRIGSSLDEYLPSVRLLNEAGYQVLLIGDQPLTHEIHAEFGGWLVDSANLGIRRDKFSLFAGMEADIFIGESGGASNLPLLKDVPCLIMNSFPYYFGLPNSWLYYKTVRDEKGRLVHYSELYSEHAYEVELDGMTIHHNSGDEIYAAVSHFIGSIPNSNRRVPNNTLDLPEDVWVTHTANCSVSPPFLQLFETNVTTGT